MNAQSKISTRASLGLGVVGVAYAALTHALSPAVLLGVVALAAVATVVASVDHELNRHGKKAPSSSLH